MSEMTEAQLDALHEYKVGFMDGNSYEFCGKPSPSSEGYGDGYIRGFADGRAALLAAEERETSRILGILDQETLRELQVVYFGCIDRPWHYFWENEHRTARSRDAYEAAIIAIWPKYYGALCYGHRGNYDNGPQEEGLALLHHKGGWTALSFWDRSIDSRGGCSSNFFVHGTFTFDQMCQIAEARFPSVWKRYKFKVRLLEVMEEGE